MVKISTFVRKPKNTTITRFLVLHFKIRLIIFLPFKVYP